MNNKPLMQYNAPESFEALLAKDIQFMNALLLERPYCIRVPCDKVFALPLVKLLVLAGWNASFIEPLQTLCVEGDNVKTPIWVTLYVPVACLPNDRIVSPLERESLLQDLASVKACKQPENANIYAIVNYAIAYTRKLHASFLPKTSYILDVSPSLWIEASDLLQKAGYEEVNTEFCLSVAETPKTRETNWSFAQFLSEVIPPDVHVENALALATVYRAFDAITHRPIGQQFIQFMGLSECFDETASIIAQAGYRMFAIKSNSRAFLIDLLGIANPGDVRQVSTLFQILQARPSDDENEELL